MKTYNIFFRLIQLLLFLIPSVTWAEQVLTMEDAIEMALKQDAMSKSFIQHQKAFDEYAIAADTWSDPKIRLGVMSVPTDTMELDQEPMTQMVLGYQQMLPRGDMSEIQSMALKARSGEKRAQYELRKRQVRRDVSKAWLNVYLQEQSEKIIRKNRRLFNQQLNVSQSLYASGRNQQQDVLQAELELSLLDDQLQQVDSMIRESRANMTRWLGIESSAYVLNEDQQQFNQPLPDLKQSVEMLQSYPLLQQYDAREDLAHEEVKLVQQKFKPQWGFDISYGKRSGLNMDGSERADFVSTIVSLDLPVFTRQKQDRELSAKKMQHQASKYEKQDEYIKAVSQLEQAYVKWQQLKERVSLYDRQVLKQAKQNAKAALNGYQSGVISFFTLTRARSAELKAELQRLNLMIEQAKVYADVIYLVGDKK